MPPKQSNPKIVIDEEMPEFQVPLDKPLYHFVWKDGSWAIGFYVYAEDETEIVIMEESMGRKADPVKERTRPYRSGEYVSKERQNELDKR